MAQHQNASDRIVAITGGARGIGAATAAAFVNAGATVVIGDIDAEQARSTAEKLGPTAHGLALDVTDPVGVSEFLDHVEGQVGPIEVLINNAGIMAVPFALTEDGFESQIGTNHLGHFALTNLLLPKITDRVVTVSSEMHLLGYISLKDLNWKSRPYSAWLAYGQSKLANLLFTKDLQRRLSVAGSPVRALAAHPGYSATNLQGHTGNELGDKFWIAANKLATDASFGARQTLFAASQDLPGNTFVGPKYGMRGPTGPTQLIKPAARSTRTATALWDLSTQLTATEFPL